MEMRESHSEESWLDYHPNCLSRRLGIGVESGPASADVGSRFAAAYLSHRNRHIPMAPRSGGSAASMKPHTSVTVSSPTAVKPGLT